MCHSRPPQANRRGNAPFEMVLFLPLLVVMLACMVTVTQVAVVDTSAASAARNVAFAGRRTPYGNGPQFTTGTTGVAIQAISASLGVTPPVRPDGGLVLSGVELPVVPMFDRYRGRLPGGRGAVAVVGDTWDHETIRFKRHPRLTLDPRVNAFGGGSVALGAFDVLDSFGTVSGATRHGTGSLTKAIQENGNAAAENRRQAERARNELAAEIAKGKKKWDLGLIRRLRRWLNGMADSAAAFGDIPTAPEI